MGTNPRPRGRGPSPARLTSGATTQLPAPSDHLSIRPFSDHGDRGYDKCSTGEMTEIEYWKRYQKAAAVRMPGFYFDHTRVATSCDRLLTPASGTRHPGLKMVD